MRFPLRFHRTESAWLLPSPGPAARTSDDDSAGERPKQIAAEVQDRMQRAMQPLLEQMKPLKLRVHALATKRETRSRGEALLAKIEKEEGRLKRLIVQDIWRGNNHPLIQYSRKYGEQRHQDLWSEISCQVPKSATRGWADEIAANS